MVDVSGLEPSQRQELRLQNLTFSLIKLESNKKEWKINNKVARLEDGMIWEPIMSTLLRRNLSMPGHATEEDEEINMYSPPRADHGVCCVGFPCSSLAPQAWQFRVPHDRSKHTYKVEMWGQYDQKSAQFIKEVHPSINREYEYKI